MEREIEKVPEQLPVLVLGNHRDMGHHRTVTEEKARYLVEQCQRDRQVLFLFVLAHRRLRQVEKLVVRQSEV